MADPVANGAELVKRLAATGTGLDKLAVARTFLAFVNRKEKRVAGSAEVIHALKLGGVPELTIQKAEQIAETGEWTGPVADKEVPVEDILLSGGAVPEEEKSAAEQAVETFDPKTAEADEAELKKVAESAKKAAELKAAAPKPGTTSVKKSDTQEKPGTSAPVVV